MSTADPIRPYQGLSPYEESDAERFFGRENDRDIIIANLLSSRLTLLYGPSGVGKTSVLNAGVAHRLRELAEEDATLSGTPEYVIVVFSEWADDPVVALRESIRGALEDALGMTLPEPEGPGLVAALEAWLPERRPFEENVPGRFEGDLLLILDQFEEYSVYHPNEKGEGTFAAELPLLLSHRVEREVRVPAMDGGEGRERSETIHEPLRVNVLLSFREDHLASLDRFKGRIQGLFNNSLRLDALSVEAARLAIEEPIRVYNETLRANGDDEARAHPIEVGNELVEEVLDAVLIGRVTIAEGGRGSVNPVAEDDSASSRRSSARVDASILQLVMTRVWERERELHSRVLRASTFRDDLGGAESIVRSHLAKALDALEPDHKDVAAAIFDHLVTPSGTKIAHPIRDLAIWARRSEKDVDPVLKALSSKKRRILRYIDKAGEERRYEISHDLLAPAILDWRARHLQQREAEAQAELERATVEKNRRYYFRFAVAAAVVAIAFGILSVFLYESRRDAYESRRDAKDAETRAERNLKMIEETNEDLKAERTKLENTRAAFRRLGIDASPDGRYLVIISPPPEKSLTVTDTVNYQPIELNRSIDGVRAVAFDTSSFSSQERGVIATAHEDGSILTWKFPSFDSIARYPGEESPRHSGEIDVVEFDADGSHLVTAGDDSTAMVWRTVDSSLVDIQYFNRPIKDIGQLNVTNDSIDISEVKGIKRALASRCLDIVFVKSEETLSQELIQAATELERLGYSPIVHYYPERRIKYRVAAGPFCRRDLAREAEDDLSRIWEDSELAVMNDPIHHCPRPRSVENLQSRSILERYSNRRIVGNRPSSGLLYTCG